MRRAGLLLALVVLGGALPAVAGAPRARFDTRVLALIPRPGFPAHAYVHPDGRVYEGTYDNPSGDTSASRVFEYGGGGALLRSWTVRGQDLAASHGVQVATSDAHRRLVLLDKNPPRALLLDTRTGRQTVYASFPTGAVPNYAAWGPDGSLYVTDYQSPVLWRIPPRGGRPAVWLRDPQLDGGGQFGATGLELLADRRTLMVGMQSEAGAAAGDPSSGRLLKVAIGPGGRPGKLTQFWESRPLDGPDGFAVAASGNVYVALLVADQIGVIGPDGVERERFPTLPVSGADGSPVPFDSPSSVQFLGRRLMVANQSYFTGTAANQAILDVYAGEPGLRRLIPKNAGPVVPRKKRRRPTRG